MRWLCTVISACCARRGSITSPWRPRARASTSAVSMASPSTPSPLPISADHLDYHADMQAYRDAKVRLFTDLIGDGGSAIVNVDDPHYEPFMFAALNRGVTLLTIGRDGAWFEIQSIENEGYGQTVHGRLVGEPVQFHLPLTGAFQVYNALVALALATSTGAQPSKALKALGKLKGARGRLELVGEHNGAAIFVDYAHKPVALETALA